MILGSRTQDAVDYVARPNQWGLARRYSVESDERSEPRTTSGTPLDALGLMHLLGHHRRIACIEDPAPPPPIDSADYGAPHVLQPLH